VNGSSVRLRHDSLIESRKFAIPMPSNSTWGSDVCCHSPEGVYTGVNDQATGSKHFRRVSTEPAKQRFSSITIAEAAIQAKCINVSLAYISCAILQ
jgi:hypothetical protein